MRMLLIGSVLMVLMVLMAAADAAPGMPPKGGRGKRSTSCSLHYFTTLKTWADAEIHCQTLGGNLASVSSSHDSQRIENIILQTSPVFNHTWIGGSDAQQEAVWLWSDGKNLKPVTWCPGQPDNFNNQQHCMLMTPGAHRCVDDVQCGEKHPFVCATDD